MRGEGGGTLVKKCFVRVCERNYSGAKFIAPIRGLILNPSLATGTAGEWEGKLRGSCRSMTSRPQLRSGRWPTHVRVKWFPWVFPPWVDSNLQVQQEPTSQACHLLIGKTEKSVSIAHGSAYHDYPFLLLPIIQDLIHWLILVSICVSIYNLTSMMLSVWPNHKPRIIMLPLFYKPPPLTWRASSSDLLWPWQMRGLTHTQEGGKSFQERHSGLSCP